MMEGSWHIASYTYISKNQEYVKNVLAKLGNTEVSVIKDKNDTIRSVQNSKFIEADTENTSDIALEPSY